MSHYLCVDCGGSKTSAVICDDGGHIRGRAWGGPSNFAYIGLEAFTSAVQETIRNALKSCSSVESTTTTTTDNVFVPPTHTFSAAWFGVSGVDSPTAIASITPILSAIVNIPPGPRLFIENDTCLLAAPVSLYQDVSHCVACIAGTGSICVSFVENDGRIQKIARAGGWGWLLGDEGGGFHVGREAIRQLLSEADTISLGASSSKGTLKTRVLEYFGVTDIYEVLAVLYLPDPPEGTSSDPDKNTSYRAVTREKRLSSLCRLVFSSAFDDGDPLALDVLRICAEYLANQINVLLDPVDVDHAAHKGLPRAVKAKESVICFGGSLVAVEAYRRMVLDDLCRRGHVFKHVEVIQDAAAVGATGLAAAFKKMREHDVTM